MGEFPRIDPTENCSDVDVCLARIVDMIKPRGCSLNYYLWPQISGSSWETVGEFTH